MSHLKASGWIEWRFKSFKKSWKRKTLTGVSDKQEFTSLYHQTLRVLIKCPSCTDANVATPATMATGTMDQKTVGTVRKRRSPVSLLAIVWGKIRCLYTINADTWLMSLTVTIDAAQIHNQVGICTTGISRMAQQATKQMSATLSKTAPALLSAWSFLAIHPSTISLMPHNA